MLKHLYHFSFFISPPLFLFLFLLWGLSPPLSPTYLHHFFQYDAKRLLQTALFGSALVTTIIFPALLTQMIKSFVSTRRSIKYGLIVFFLIGLTSSFMSKAPLASLTEWSLYVLLLLYALYWSAYGQCIGKKVFFITIILLFFSLTIYFYFALHFHPTYYFIKKGARNLFPFFSISRHFSQFMTWVIPILPLLHMYFKKNFTSICLSSIFSVFASFCWILIVYDASRSLFYALFIAAIICIIILRKKTIHWALYQLSYLVLACVIISFLLHFSILNSHHFFNRVDHLYSSSSSGRRNLYLLAAKLSLSHPILGIGPMNFSLYYDAMSSKPQNFILMIMAEWGIPATLLLLYIIIGSIKIFIYKMKQLIYTEFCIKNHITIIVISNMVALLTGLLSSTVTSTMQSPISQILFSIILGNCITLSTYIHTSPQKEKYNINKVKLIEKKIPLTFLLLSLLLSIAIYTIVVIPQINNLTLNQLNWLHHQPNSIHPSPRFWWLGWIPI